MAYTRVDRDTGNVNVMLAICGVAGSQTYVLQRKQKLCVKTIGIWILNLKFTFIKNVKFAYLWSPL